MRQKRTFCIALLSFGLGAAYAQEAITASGGDALGSGGSVAYSVGQVVYATGTGTGGSVTQGVQHPFEILTISIKEETALNIFLSVYPNPTSDHLILQVNDFGNQKLTYHLSDLKGKLFERKDLTGTTTQINTSDLVPAIYFLNVILANKTIKSFKIIKN